MAIVYTQADLDNLKNALLTGALEVQIGDRRVKYRSQSEILKLIEIVSQALGDDTDDSPNVVQATFSRGGR